MLGTGLDSSHCTTHRPQCCCVGATAFASPFCCSSWPTASAFGPPRRSPGIATRARIIASVIRTSIEIGIGIDSSIAAMRTEIGRGAVPISLWEPTDRFPPFWRIRTRTSSSRGKVSRPPPGSIHLLQKLRPSITMCLVRSSACPPIYHPEKPSQPIYGHRIS